MYYSKRLKQLFKSLTIKQSTSHSRRSALTKLIASTGVVTLGASVTSKTALASDNETESSERFPGDPPEHFVVYQFNKAEHEYHEHVLGSVGAMLGKYGDNVDIVVACFGRGIHVLAKKPARPVEDSIKERVKSLAAQGVKFHACGRTLLSMNWTEEDMLPFAKVVEVGVADMMELQEKNYAYVAW